MSGNTFRYVGSLPLPSVLNDNTFEQQSLDMNKKTLIGGAYERDRHRYQSNLDLFTTETPQIQVWKVRVVKGQRIIKHLH